MNINQLLPKHVKLADAKAQAIKYEGTFTELVSLVESGAITLVTDNAGNVTGIWVESGAGNVMLDNLSGENFERVYGGYNTGRTMRWIENIVQARASGKQITNINEDSGSCLIGDLKYVFDSFKHSKYVESQPAATGLPTRVIIDSEDTSLSAVRNRLKKTFGHCLAKGIQPKIDYVDGKVVVSDIVWGRKLSDSELAELA